MFELKAIDDIVKQGQETASAIISDSSVYQQLMQKSSTESVCK